MYSLLWYNMRGVGMERASVTDCWFVHLVLLLHGLPSHTFGPDLPGGVVLWTFTLLHHTTRYLPYPTPPPPRHRCTAPPHLHHPTAGYCSVPTPTHYLPHHTTPYLRPCPPHHHLHTLHALPRRRAARLTATTAPRRHTRYTHPTRHTFAPAGFLPLYIYPTHTPPTATTPCTHAPTPHACYHTHLPTTPHTARARTRTGHTLYLSPFPIFNGWWFITGSAGCRLTCYSPLTLRTVACTLRHAPVATTAGLPLLFTPLPTVPVTVTATYHPYPACAVVAHLLGLPQVFFLHAGHGLRAYSATRAFAYAHPWRLAF